MYTSSLNKNEQYHFRTSFKSLIPKTTIYELLKKFKLNNKKVAIEYNGIIIPKLNYKKKIFEKH